MNTEKIINVIEKGEEYFKVSSAEPKEIKIKIAERFIKGILIKRILKREVKDILKNLFEVNFYYLYKANNKYYLSKNLEMGEYEGIFLTNKELDLKEQEILITI